MIARRPRGHRARPSRRAWRATCSSSPAASRSARTTTSSPRSRPAASRRSSGACGSSPASRCGSAAAATTLVFGLPGNPLSAIVCFGAVHRARRCAACRASATPARASSAGRLGEPAGPSDGRTTFLTSRARAAAPTACWRPTPTERQGSHMTGALGESDGFVVAPHGSGPLPAGRAGRRRAVCASWRESDFARAASGSDPAPLDRARQSAAVHVPDPAASCSTSSSATACAATRTCNGAVTGPRSRGHAWSELRRCAWQRDAQNILIDDLVPRSRRGAVVVPVRAERAPSRGDPHARVARR